MSPQTHMKRRHAVLVVLLAVAIFAAGYGSFVIRRGFSATDQPTTVERVMARTVRNLGIPAKARNETNPWSATPDLLQDARANFTEHCAGCHGKDGDGRSGIGQNLYPKAPDLRQPETQNLKDGEIHYIIQNGVRLTGMPALGNPHGGQDDNAAWKLVLFVRSIGLATPKKNPSRIRRPPRRTTSVPWRARNATQKSTNAGRKRPWRMSCAIRANIQMRSFPISTTNNVSPKFTKDQVAFVYGSIWKQRYFTKIGDDYFPEPAQWDVTNKKWLPYFVPNGGDWWAPFYPPDNMKRPTGPTCDGCHSVDYNIQTKQVAEWNVGCERCHGPGSAHVRSCHARQYSESGAHGLCQRQ